MSLAEVSLTELKSRLHSKTLTSSVVSSSGKLLQQMGPLFLPADTLPAMMEPSPRLAATQTEVHKGGIKGPRYKYGPHRSGSV